MTSQTLKYKNKTAQVYIIMAIKHFATPTRVKYISTQMLANHNRGNFCKICQS